MDGISALVLGLVILLFCYFVTAGKRLPDQCFTVTDSLMTEFPNRVGPLLQPSYSSEGPRSKFEYLGPV